MFQFDYKFGLLVYSEIKITKKFLTLKGLIFFSQHFLNFLLHVQLHFFSSSFLVLVP